jgi:cation diffusion facilitator family transporter
MATRLELEDIASEHDFLSKSHDRNARLTFWVVVLTSAMMIGEIVAGYLTGSMALLADGYHMATHAGALGIAAIAYRFARRHVANPKYTFGTGKVGDLAGFASAIVLGMVALGIAGQSAIRLIEPVSIVYAEATLVALIGLAVNVASALLLSSGSIHHAHDHDHDHAHDNNFRAAYLHVMADAVTSVLAIIALLAGWRLGWVWLDPVIGVVGALVIARWSWGLIRDTSAMLLDVSDPELMEEVRAALGEMAPRVRDLHVWKIGPHAHGAIVSLCGQADAEEIRQRLAGVHEIAHLTVEVRPSTD